MRRRNRNKKQVKIVICSVICLLLIMMVGYAAFSTNLTLMAKGNIKPVNAAWQLKKNIVTSGEGLYVDNYETGRYVFKGQNPNNHIKFNGELWRIIAVEADNTIKIISKNSIGAMNWDDITNRNNENNTYCNYEFTIYGETKYWGCNVWGAISGIYNDGVNTGTVNTSASLNIYLNSDYYNNINEDKKYIINHNFNVGRVGFAGLIDVIYKEEKDLIWKGMIGLPSVSDFLKSTTNSACNSYENSRSEQTPCTLENGNYLDELKAETWTLHAYNTSDTVPFKIIGVHTISMYGGEIKGGLSGWYSAAHYKVRPVLFLNSNISLSGSGTESNPYVIK